MEPEPEPDALPPVVAGVDQLDVREELCAKLRLLLFEDATVDIEVEPDTVERTSSLPRASGADEDAMRRRCGGEGDGSADAGAGAGANAGTTRVVAENDAARRVGSVDREEASARQQRCTHSKRGKKEE